MFFDPRVKYDQGSSLERSVRCLVDQLILAKVLLAWWIFYRIGCAIETNINMSSKTITKQKTKIVRISLAEGRKVERTAMDCIGIARGLMNTHGLVDWKLDMGSSKSTAGFCFYDHKTIRISMAFGVSVAEQVLINTIKHEIAHALSGAGHGHDSVWKAKALEIGCDGERCHREQFSHPPFLMKCPNACFQPKGVHRRSRKAKVCRKCSSPVQLFNNPHSSQACPNVSPIPSPVSSPSPVYSPTISPSSSSSEIVDLTLY